LHRFTTIKYKTMEQKLTTQPAEGQQDEEQNRVWEINHLKILDAITAATKYCGSHLPTITSLSKATELSRQTIHKHFKSCSSHPAWRQRGEMFESMQIEVLLGICHRAMNGNLPAAKLYLELTGKLKPKAQNENSAANNVQINGMVLNQQVMQSLNPEQIKQIEGIIKSAVTVSEPAKAQIAESANGLTQVDTF